MADHSITIDVIGKNLQETVSLLKEIRDDIKNINSTPVTVKVNTAAATRALNSLRQELGSIAQYLNQGSRNNSDAMMETINSGVDSIIQKLGELNSMTVSPDIDTSGIEQGATAAERLASGLEVAAGVASGLSSVFSGLGDFGGMFADAFGGMASIFDFDAAGTAKRYLTAMATRAVTSQIGGILERYDIMNTFVPYMELAGVDAATAQASLNAVDLSIRGIPIGLDEAAFRLRKYQMYMGDIERATNFTIGIQKAITAGGASEQMKTTAYTQIDRLLATGKLGQSRQWLSLFNGLGVSLKFLREELNLDPTADLKTVAADLASGTIATEDFIRAIERLADNPGLDQAIGIYKGTIEAWRSNINNAIKRGGQNILENVNSVLENIYDQGITGFMKNVRDGIDTVSKDAGEYIQNNPQHFQTIGDAIGGLISRFTSLDGGRFVDNLVGHISGIADGVGRIFDSMPPNFIEDFTAFATTWAGPMATLMKAAQSGLGVVLGVFDRMQGFDMPGLMKKISDQIWNMSDAVAKILGVIPDGMLGDLMAFGLVWGRPLASVLGSISSALKDMATVAAAGTFSSASGIFGQLYWLVSQAPGLFAAAGAVAALGFALKSINDTRIENGAELFGLDEVDNLVQSMSTLDDDFGKAVDDFNTNIDEIRKRGEETQAVLDKIFETDEKIRNARDNRELNDLYEQQVQNLMELEALQSDINLEMDAAGRIQNAEAIREEASAYAELATAKAEAQAVESMMSTTMETKITAQTNIDTLRRERSRLQQQVIDAQKELDSYVANGQAYKDENGKLIPYYDFGLGTRIAELEYGIEQTSDKIYGSEGINAQIREQLGVIEEADAQMQSLKQHSTEAADAMLEGFSNVGEEVKGIDAATQAIISTYETLKTEAAEMLEKQVTGFDKVETVSAASIVEMGNVVSGQNDELERYNTALAQIRESLIGLSDEEIEKITPALQRVLGGGFEDREYAYGFAEALLGTPEDLETYIQETWEQSDWKDKVASLLADINTVLAGGSEAEEATREQPELFPGLQEALDNFGELNELDLSDFLSNIGDMSSAAGDAFGDVESAAQSASQQIDAVKSSMENAASTASGKAGEMGSFAGSLESVASSAANAFSNVSALAGAISRLQDKTVTIKINVLGSLGRLAQGGMAGYYASGGNVSLGFPGMGSGTDIIPAWLTPGEYVMRRSAVGLFGSRFMDRVNKMDIGGAFDALMTRISNPMMHGNTYNRDNHATVNNYFYGDNGQNYSQRKAYRYVGSL